MTDDAAAGRAEDRVVVAVAVDAGGEGPDADLAASDLVADRLFALGASAVSELVDAATGRTELVADVPVGAVEAVAALGRPHRVLERDASWDAGWRDHATATPVGEHLLVRPEWVAAASPAGAAGAAGMGTVGIGAVGIGAVEVVVAAADAFGAGSHPTTVLCLEAVERSVVAGQRVLDVGSGSGVLGVAALLLGAGSLVAVDVDPVAVAATRRTAELNGVADRLVEASTRTVADVCADHGPFDLVLANLLVPIVEELGGDLAATLGPGGHLVVSGLLHEHEERAATAVGLTVVRTDRAGAWSAIECGPDGPVTPRR